MLSVVMAVFNEAKSVRRTIERILAKRIHGLIIELIIIESNSTDGTREIVQEYEGLEHVKVIWQNAPNGKGHAVRAGLEHIKGNYVLIQDADDEYDIDDYDALMTPLIQGDAVFVLGSRHNKTVWKMRQFSDQPFLGHFLNTGHWFFTGLINALYGLHLTDPFTMYKVFRADCLAGLSFECNLFDFDYELLIKLIKKGYLPVEIPVNYRSRSFKEGKKIHLFRDSWALLYAIIKFRIRQ